MKYMPPAILKTTSAKRDVILAVMIEPTSSLETPPPPLLVLLMKDAYETKCWLVLRGLHYRVLHTNTHLNRENTFSFRPQENASNLE